MKKVAMLAFVLVCMAGTSAFSAGNDASLAQMIAKSKSQEVSDVSAPVPTSAFIYRSVDLAIGNNFPDSTAQEGFLIQVTGDAAKTFYDKVLTELEPERMTCPVGVDCLVGYNKKGAQMQCSKLDKNQPNGFVVQNEYTCLMTVNSKGLSIWKSK